MQKVFLILFVGVLGIWVSQQIQKTPIVDDVLLENVEALANYEITLPTDCWSSGNVTCPGVGIKVEVVYEGYSLRK